MDAKQLRARARRRRTELARVWRDSRFERVIGRLVGAGLMTTTMPIAPHREPISIEDALWVGRTEPRVLELLPALIVKRPSLFIEVGALSPDLEAVVRALRKSRVPDDFRGVPGASLFRWVRSVGQRGKLPSQLRSFRLREADIALLDRLSTELGLTQTDVIRRGLRTLAAARLREHAGAKT